MSHKVGVNTIHIRDGSIGQDLGISFSLSLTIKVTVSIVSPGSKVVGSSHSISMVVGSNRTVDMVNKLSLSLSLTIETKPESQVVVGGCKVGIVHMGDCSTKVANKLAVRGGSKAAQDQKFHGDFWSTSR